MARRYKNLDPAGKKNINDLFLSKICSRSGTKSVNTNAVGQFEKSNGFSEIQAPVQNNPASMYEKYGVPQTSKFVNKRPQRRKERKRGVSQNTKMRLSTLNSDPHSDFKVRNETPTSLIDSKNLQNSKVSQYFIVQAGRKRLSKPRVQSKGRMFKKSEVTLRGNPVLDNTGLSSTSLFPVKPLKKFTNPLSEDKAGFKLPQSVNSRQNRSSQNKLRRYNKKRNFSDDGEKPKQKNFSEERGKRPKDYQIKNTKNFSKMGKADVVSRDGASSTNASRVGKFSQKGRTKRSKRAFSGNTRRVPLETGSKVKLPKIQKESEKKSEYMQSTQKSVKMTEDLRSDFDKRNGISLNESQKESIKGNSLSLIP